MTFPDACQYLDSFINYEQHLDRLSADSFTLERFSKLLRALGEPHKNFKAVHVAGTKGKGSTCVLVAGILRQHGFRVGLYTSPHLLSVRERIRVLDAKVAGGSKKEIPPDCISEKDFCNTLKRITSALEHAKKNPANVPTYFEVLTALAFCYFETVQVDYVVLETGLGGRLDATNVVKALVCGITPISREHTQILGDTLAAIAAEKAAIIKDPVPVIVAPQDPQALKVIENRCRQVQARPYYIGKEIQYKSTGQTAAGQTLSLKTPGGCYEFPIPLVGEYQCANAAMAVALVESLSDIGKKIKPKAVARAADEWFLPGRFQIIHQEPCVILDVAHTPESVAMVGETIKGIFPRRKILVILGLSRDKDAAGIIRNIHRFADELVLTRSQHPRSMDFSTQKLTTGIFRQTATVPEALTWTLTKAGKDDVILVTGSFFVVGEAWEKVRKDF